MPPTQPESRPLPISDTALKALRWLLIALSLLALLSFLAAALQRLRFPGEYDWIEDGVLASVRHLRSGLPLYQPPTIHFTPYLYTPIYLYAASALSHVTGLSYVPLRLISIGATLGCLAFIYALVFRETRHHLSAIAAAGFFASMYPVVGAALDVGRVDMLYLLFVLAAFYATRHMHPVLAALLWICAFQTKQGVLPVAMLALCWDWQRPRRLLLSIATFVAGLGVSILWLTHATGGWYRYYVFQMAGSYGFLRAQTVRFIPVDIVGVCGIAVLVLAAALLIKPPSLRSPILSFYVLGSIGMVGFTGYLRAHRGANLNSLVPAYAWIAILFGIGLARLFSQLNEIAATPQQRPMQRTVQAIVLLATCAQLLAHFYSPNEFVPSAQDRNDRAAFEEQLRTIGGIVLVHSHPEDELLAGGPLFASSESVGSVVEASRHGPGDNLIAQYADLLHSGTLRAVVLDQPAEQQLAWPRTWISSDFLQLYPLKIAAAGGSNTRFSSEPHWIYLPCTSVALARKLDPAADISACAPTARQ